MRVTDEVHGLTGFPFFIFFIGRIELFRVELAILGPA